MKVSPLNGNISTTHELQNGFVTFKKLQQSQILLSLRQNYFIDNQKVILKTHKEFLRDQEIEKSSSDSSKNKYRQNLTSKKSNKSATTPKTQTRYSANYRQNIPGSNHSNQHQHSHHPNYYHPLTPTLKRQPFYPNGARPVINSSPNLENSFAPAKQFGNFSSLLKEYQYEQAVRAKSNLFEGPMTPRSHKLREIINSVPQTRHYKFYKLNLDLQTMQRRSTISTRIQF
jgi:hypothetical protein